MDKVITLETDYLRYSFDYVGKVVEFLDKSTGKNHARENCYAFVLLEGREGDGGRELPSRVEFLNGIISVHFKHIEFRVLVQCFDTNIRFTIVDVTPSAFDFGRFLFCHCELINDGMSPEFSGCLIPRSVKCCPVEIPGRCGHVGALAYSALSALNVSAALIGMAPDQLREAMKKAYDGCTIDDVAFSPVCGAYALDAEANNMDYMIVFGGIDFRSDEWINELKSKNIKQVYLHHGALYLNNDYEVSREKFPRGIIDFKEMVVDKLHKNGIMVFLHNYSSLVELNCSFVTPVPHSDLVYIAEYTLAKDIEADDTCIYLEEGSEQTAFNRQDMDKNASIMLVDKEMIDVGAKQGNVLTECIRGTLSTFADSHKKGTKIRHLLICCDRFVPIPGSSLFYEHLARVAKFINDAGFDGMYCDGFGYMRNMLPEKDRGLGWYYNGLIMQTILRCVRKDFYVDGDQSPMQWAVLGRTGALDTYNSGYQYVIKRHVERNLCIGARRYLPCTLGWWRVYPPADDGSKDRPNWKNKIVFEDDVDYLGTRAIGYNWGLSYHWTRTPVLGDDMSEGDMVDQGCPQYHRLFQRIQAYTTLRDQHCVPNEICQLLRDNNRNFCLVQDKGGVGFAEQKRLFAKPYSLHEGENEVYMINPYHVQQPTVRLIAQCACAPNDGVVIAHFDRNLPLSEQEDSCFFDTPLDILGREALGVWIKGIEKDAYVNIRLDTPEYGGEQGCSMHVVNLNYSGWKYFMLCEHDNGDYADVIYLNDDSDTHREYFYQRAMFYYDRIGSIKIFYTCDPSEIYLGDVCAYPVDDSPVVAPSIAINGKEVLFETELSPGSYIEMKPGECNASMYDILGNKKEVSVKGVMPELDFGENLVSLKGGADGVFRLKMHLVVKDETISF